MKKITLFITFLFCAQVAFCVAAKTIEENKVTFHNFSGGSYSVAGYIITVNTTQYMVGNLTIITGSINTAAGSFLTFSGFNAGVSTGSVALWRPGTNFSNPSPADLVDFVQWGAAGQAYAAVAVLAGIWTTGTFVNSGLPITRSNNYAATGSNEWMSSLNLQEVKLEDMLQIGPIPFDDKLNFVFEQGHDFTVLRIYDMLGKLLQEQKLALNQQNYIYQTTNLTKGVYLVQLKNTAGKMLVKRVIKN